MKINNLACPIDAEHLVLTDRQLRCVNGHCFDIARQGYVNLLPVQYKRSKSPGDSKEMVTARQRFLNTGAYEPVAEALSAALCVVIDEISGSTANDSQPPVCLDAGCGEGYYLDYVLNYLYAKKALHAQKALHAKNAANVENIIPDFIGLDISKEAIVAAAKRNRDITWVVGTNRQPPIMAGSVDIILCVFGFHSFQGLNKILPVGGKLILVEPGPDHLHELRQVTYPQVKETRLNKLDDAVTLGFKQFGEQTLRFSTLPISNESLQNLLLMTPHFFKATQAGRAAAAKLDKVSLTVDMVFRRLEKIENYDIRV